VGNVEGTILWAKKREGEKNIPKDAFTTPGHRERLEPFRQVRRTPREEGTPCCALRQEKRRSRRIAIRSGGMSSYSEGGGTAKRSSSFQRGGSTRAAETTRNNLLSGGWLEPIIRDISSSIFLREGSLQLSRG